MSNNLDSQYQALLKDILDNGTVKNDRTGTGTISVFGRTIRHKMSEGFPLLTTKKMHWKSIVVELLWFLRGDTNIKYLVDNDCHIWVGDAWTNYSKKVIANNLQLIPAVDLPKNKEEFIDKIKTDNEFADKWGDLGPVYGKSWRNWEYIDSYSYSDGDQYPGTKYIDQIATLIHTLKTNPDSRRMLVSAWNVGELDDMVLPPCFTEDALVCCKDKYKNISNVKVDDYVLSEDSSYKKVYELHKTKYTGNLINLRVYGNTKYINVTPNHPFLTKDRGYIKASEITKEDYLAIPINKKEIIPSFSTTIKDNQYSEKTVITKIDTDDYWFLLGYFLGDGWLVDSKKEVYFVVNNQQVHSILPKLKSILGLAKLTNSGTNCTKYVGKKKQVFEILSLFGKYADKKTIPQFVFDAPKKFIEKFIEGYKSADGCKTDDGVSFTTTSENIAYGLQLLYAKLGVKASVYFQKRPSKTVIENREVNQMDTFSVNLYKQKNKSSKYKFSENYLWLKVKDINTTNYDGYVYNLSTEDNHTYNVYNIINHNCHYSFQVYTRELSFEERIRYANSLPLRDRNNNPVILAGVPEETFQLDEVFNIPIRAISILWSQRSVDSALGLPFNIASYGLLLEIIAKEVNMIPDELIGMLGDTHIYLNQIEGVKEQLSRSPYQLPKLKINPIQYEFGKPFPERLDFDLYSIDNFELVNYQSHPKIYFPLSN